MPKFTNLSLKALTDRLGAPSGRSVQTGSDMNHHGFQMLWFCNGPNAPACFATAEAADKPMAADLTTWEQEIFDNAPRPEEGWTLRACPRHRGAFADHPEVPD